MTNHITLRDPKPGDMGWIIHRHGVLYAQEYGWDLTYEAAVAAIVARFALKNDPACERGWIAEWDGAVVGSIFLVRQSDDVAKLRLLYVEPSARGHGLGKQLIATCLQFAREAGYKKVTLWTYRVLEAARHLYTAAGFELVEEEIHDAFGKNNLTSETWELEL